MNLLSPLETGLNAFRLSYDPQLLKPIQAHYQKTVASFFESPQGQEMMAGEYYYSEPIGSDYYLFSYDTYPLFWVTNHSDITYALFYQFFKESGLEKGLKKHLDIHKKPVMYCGFFVVGNRATETMWHYDYRNKAQGFTLIAPLFDWHSEHGHLLYKDTQEKERQYRYKKGEAIVFGPGFMHSTEPYSKTERPRVLLSMTFGSDKWEHWPVLKQNIAEQSYYYALPCGHIAGRCECETKQSKSLWGRLFS